MSEKRASELRSVEASVEVAAPIWRVYHQWTVIEELPIFLGGVERVDSLSSARSVWHTSFDGVERVYEAELIDTTQDERLIWTTLEGESPRRVTTVSFEVPSDTSTRISLRIEFDEGSIDAEQERVSRDLERFRLFIERD